MPNFPKIDQKVIKIPTTSIKRPRKNLPKFGFLVKNITSGNPGEDPWVQCDLGPML
jgi:hypothetical protein